MRLSAPAALLLSAAVFVSGLAAESGGRELYALRYGVSPDMHWLFYALRAEGRVLLVDCGFSDPRRAGDFGMRGIEPAKLAERGGIRPEEVSDILVTHAHFDHMGSLREWPKANIWIEKRALEAFLASPFSPELAAWLRGNPRLRPFVGEASPIAGLVIRRVGIHSAGSCIVEIELPGRKLVLTGDEFYFRREWERPSKDLAPAKAALAGRLRELEASGALILTMHDPAIAPEGSAQEGSIVEIYPGASRLPAR